MNYVELRMMVRDAQPLKISGARSSFFAISMFVFSLCYTTLVFVILWKSILAHKVLAIIIVAVLFILNMVSLARIIFLSDAVLTGRNLELKTLFGTTYNLDISQIEKTTLFRLRNSIHTIVQFRDHNYNQETALILNFRYRFGDSDYPAGEVIELSKELYLLPKT